MIVDDETWADIVATYYLQRDMRPGVLPANASTVIMSRLVAVGFVYGFIVLFTSNVFNELTARLCVASFPGKIMEPSRIIFLCSAGTLLCC